MTRVTAGSVGWIGVALAVGACGPGEVPSTVDAGGVDAGAPVDASGADAARLGDAGPSADAGPTPASCGPVALTSACGAHAIIRVLATLPPGAASVTGTLGVFLNHHDLGSGASGGVPHTRAIRSGVTLDGSTSAEIQLDFCAGGEMWSEENCDFILLVGLDLDGNELPDPGEPVGRAVLPINCHATASPCVQVLLDCLDGESCATFADGPACTCRGSCADVASASRIIACSP